MEPKQEAILEINDTKYSLHEGINTIGRNKDAVVNIRNMVVSQNHALIVIYNNQHFISDLKSSNSTYLEDCILHPLKMYPLIHNAKIVFGNLTGTYRIEEITDEHNNMNEGNNDCFIPSQNLYNIGTQVLEIPDEVATNYVFDEPTQVADWSAVRKINHNVQKKIPESLEEVSLLSENIQNRISIASSSSRHKENIKLFTTPSTSHHPNEVKESNSVFDEPTQVANWSDIRNLQENAQVLVNNDKKTEESFKDSVQYLFEGNENVEIIHSPQELELPNDEANNPNLISEVANLHEDNSNLHAESTPSCNSAENKELKENSLIMDVDDDDELTDCEDNSKNEQKLVQESAIPPDAAENLNLIVVASTSSCSRDENNKELNEIQLNNEDDDDELTDCEEEIKDNRNVVSTTSANEEKLHSNSQKKSSEARQLDEDGELTDCEDNSKDGENLLSRLRLVDNQNNEDINVNARSPTLISSPGAENTELNQNQLTDEDDKSTDCEDNSKDGENLLSRLAAPQNKNNELNEDDELTDCEDEAKDKENVVSTTSNQEEKLNSNSQKETKEANRLNDEDDESTDCDDNSKDGENLLSRLAKQDKNELNKDDESTDCEDNARQDGENLLSRLADDNQENEEIDLNARSPALISSSEAENKELNQNQLNDEDDELTDCEDEAKNKENVVSTTTNEENLYSISQNGSKEANQLNDDEDDELTDCEENAKNDVNLLSGLPTRDENGLNEDDELTDCEDEAKDKENVVSTTTNEENLSSISQKESKETNHQDPVNEVDDELTDCEDAAFNGEENLLSRLAGQNDTVSNQNELNEDAELTDCDENASKDDAENLLSQLANDGRNNEEDLNLNPQENKVSNQNVELNDEDDELTDCEEDAENLLSRLADADSQNKEELLNLNPTSTTITIISNQEEMQNNELIEDDELTGCEVDSDASKDDENLLSRLASRKNEDEALNLNAASSTDSKETGSNKLPHGGKKVDSKNSQNCVSGSNQCVDNVSHKITLLEESINATINDNEDSSIMDSTIPATQADVDKTNNDELNQSDFVASTQQFSSPSIKNLDCTNLEIIIEEDNNSVKIPQKIGTVEESHNNIPESNTNNLEIHVEAERSNQIKTVKLSDEKNEHSFLAPTQIMDSTIPATQITDNKIIDELNQSDFLAPTQHSPSIKNLNSKNLEIEENNVEVITEEIGKPEESHIVPESNANHVEIIVELSDDDEDSFLAPTQIIHLKKAGKNDDEIFMAPTQKFIPDEPKEDIYDAMTQITHQDATSDSSFINDASANEPVKISEGMEKGEDSSNTLEKNDGGIVINANDNDDDELFLAPTQKFTPDGPSSSDQNILDDNNIFDAATQVFMVNKEAQEDDRTGNNCDNNEILHKDDDAEIIKLCAEKENTLELTEGSLDLELTRSFIANKDSVNLETGKENLTDEIHGGIEKIDSKVSESPGIEKIVEEPINQKTTEENHDIFLQPTQICAVEKCNEVEDLLFLAPTQIIPKKIQNTVDANNDKISALNSDIQNDDDEDLIYGATTQKVPQRNSSIEDAASSKIPETTSSCPPPAENVIKPKRTYSFKKKKCNLDVSLSVLIDGKPKNQIISETTTDGISDAFPLHSTLREPANAEKPDFCDLTAIQSNEDPRIVEVPEDVTEANTDSAKIPKSNTTEKTEDSPTTSTNNNKQPSESSKSKTKNPKKDNTKARIKSSTISIDISEEMQGNNSKESKSDDNKDVTLNVKSSSTIESNTTKIYLSVRKDLIANPTPSIIISEGNKSNNSISTTLISDRTQNNLNTTQASKSMAFLQSKMGKTKKNNVNYSNLSAETAAAASSNNELLEIPKKVVRSTRLKVTTHQQQRIEEKPPEKVPSSRGRRRKNIEETVVVVDESSATPKQDDQPKNKRSKKVLTASSSASSVSSTVSSQASTNTASSISSLASNLSSTVSTIASKISSSSSSASSVNLENTKETSVAESGVKKRGRKKKEPFDDDEVIEESPSKRQKTSTDSSSATRGQRKMKHKVVFTMINDPKLIMLVHQLGANMVDTINTCTVLVAERIQRTEKLLCAIGLGKPICSPEWLNASKKARGFLDPWDYLLVDRDAEKKWDFLLTESLERGKNKKLFDSFSFRILVNEATDVLKSAIEACGGKCIIRIPKATENTYIISNLQNTSKYRPLLKKNPELKVIEPEAIFDGVLRQEIRFSRHLL